MRASLSAPIFDPEEPIFFLPLADFFAAVLAVKDSLTPRQKAARP